MKTLKGKLKERFHQEDKSYYAVCTIEEGLLISIYMYYKYVPITVSESGHFKLHQQKVTVYLPQHLQERISYTGISSFPVINEFSIHLMEFSNKKHVTVLFPSLPYSFHSISYSRNIKLSHETVTQISVFSWNKYKVITGYLLSSLLQT